ncbi:MAG: GNAT family N-acetyltransferase [Candidatus Micrarchaeota archaeon]|nr:GNAT family N-acetyltransferase [Candidatus Micrarchaeota archaeon]
MEEAEKRKEMEKKMEAPSALKRKELLEDMKILSSNEIVEIKRLDEEDLEEVVKLMRKALFEIGKKEMKEIKDILKQGHSYGAYVDRFIIGVGLGFPIYFDRSEKFFSSEEAPNALYMEDAAVLIDYQGKGVIEMLVEEREKEARVNGLEYVVGISGDNINGDIRAEIEKGGTLMQKKYLQLNYRFANTESGFVVFKKV